LAISAAFISNVSCVTEIFLLLEKIVKPHNNDLAVVRYTEKHFISNRQNKWHNYKVLMENIRDKKMKNRPCSSGNFIPPL